jgi:hypothetical protein
MPAKLKECPDQLPAPPLRFSLRTLFAITTLVAVVVACFAWNAGAGIFGYLGCLILVLAVVRSRAEIRRRAAIVADGGPPASAALMIFVGSILALAGAIAFCATCSVVQVPYVDFVPRGRDADRLFRQGLLISIPLGTVAMAFVYLFTGPPRYQRIPPRSGAEQKPRE